MTKKELETLYASVSSENFNQFLNALKKAKSTREVSTLDLQTLLGKVIDDATDDCRAYGSKGREMTEEEKAVITKNAKTIALYMLVLQETRAYTQLSRMALLFLEYSSYVIRSSYDLCGTALKAVSYRMTDTGFTWSSIENATSADMLAYKLCSNARFDKNVPLPEITEAGKGTVTIEGGRMKVSSARRGESTVRSFETDEGIVSVETRNGREEKLKQSDSDNALRLDEFMTTFMAGQDGTQKAGNTSQKVTFTAGSRYAVCITDYEELPDGDCEIRCRVVGDQERRECTIDDEELIKGIYTRDLLPYMFDGDCIMDAVLVDASGTPAFSVRDSYSCFAKAAAESDAKTSKVVEGRVIRIFRGASEDKDRIIWMTANGYGGLLKDTGTYKEGDKGYVTVRYVQTSGDDIFINLDEAQIGEGTTVEHFSEEDVLFEKFTVSIDAAESAVRNAEAPKDDADGLTVIMSIGRIMSRKIGVPSLERYRSALVAKALANAAGDADGIAFAGARAEYLRDCLCVAQRISVKASATSGSLYEDEREIASLLPYLEDCVSEAARKAILEHIEKDSAPGEIARLMMAHRLSRLQPDDVRFDEEQMRRRICEIVGTRDQFVSLQQKGGGKYGMGELDNVEFKSSYVMRNDGKGADLDYQGRGQVFEAVCGLLNKDGGTVYVGVNNNGDPITGPGYGINGDLDWFEKNFDTVKMIKSHQAGHPVPKPKNIDTYCLFLNDERDLYFKPSLKDYITISPTEDQDAIRITVRPSMFEIAVLYTDSTWKNGQAFVRDGQETVPMSRIQQEQRLMKLRSVGKVEQFILTLTEAIDKQHKVVLKDYASSNSNTVNDRFVVPVNLVYNDENLWAYDIDRKELREFRLARIGSIVTDIENPSYSHAYKKEEADVFRWINPKVDYHIKLKISVAAYNNLKEEYSNTRNLPESELYQVSPERWILDTHLQGLGAVRRFYMGLADQIEILDTEDSEKLKDEIRSFMAKNIKL